MNVARPRVSYADLQQMPDDGQRYELYDGELVVVPAPLPRHQIAALELYDILRAYSRERGGLVIVSPIDIVFTEYDVLQPDIVVFAGTRRKLVKPDEAIRSVPDLAVEVLSPGTAARDRGKKMLMFRSFGVPEYWIVDPVQKTVELYRLKERAYALVQKAAGTDLVRSQNLRGLEFRADVIFSSI